MPQSTFDEVLDAIEQLPIDEQADLLEVVRRRLAEHARQQIVEDINQARAEFRNGEAKPTSVEDSDARDSSVNREESSTMRRNVIEYRQPGIQASQHPIVRFILKFALSLAACTATCAFIWGCFVTDVLYHCTDSVGFDFLSGPGSWVHGAVAGQPGNYGDTILAGWTLGRLKALWFSMIVASLIVSTIVGVVPWKIPEKLGYG